MPSQGTFGRRIGLEHRLSRTRTSAGIIATEKHGDLAEIPVQRSSPPPTPMDASPVDEELREWKQARKKGITIPWRPLLLMASLCFGIASFALPDSVNDAVQWLLYILMAASFCAGVSRRRATKG